MDVSQAIPKRVTECPRVRRLQFGPDPGRGGASMCLVLII